MTGDLKPPAINPMSIEAGTGTLYPAHLDCPAEPRIKRRLGDALGLTKFGVNLSILPPGAWSAFRHWHEQEDEFVYILEGEATLVTDHSEQILGPGAAAGFPGGKADGHVLKNNTENDLVYLEVGNRFDDEDVHYPDVDLHLEKRPGKRQYYDKKGNPLEGKVTA
jgi:uncharacterized cupin superfamily protein